MEIGDLMFEFDVIARCTGNIARTAGTRARDVDCFMHGGEHGGVLAHAEIIVRAPDRDRVCVRLGEPCRRGKGAALALQIGKNPVTTLGLDLVECRLESPGVVHLHVS